MAGERDARLDVLKAAAVALVVLGHAVILAYGSATAAPVALASAFSVLAALHVPLFVFVSGYLAPARPGAAWVGKRAVRLLVPYAAWAFLQWLVWYRGHGIRWLVKAAVVPATTNALWFLFVLFELCVLWALVSRSTPLAVVAVLACVLAPLNPSPYLAPGYVALLFPVFAAGRLARSRSFEPGWWSLPLAAIVLAAAWAGPGANMLHAAPVWAGAMARLGTFASGAVVRVLRLALMLSLSSAAFFVTRGVRRGAWLGALTLGVYAAHPFFLPHAARGAGLPGVVVAFVLAMAGATLAAWLASRFETTAFLLMGSGQPPRWARGLAGAPPS